MNKRAKIITIASVSVAFLLIIGLSIGLAISLRIKAEVKDQKEMAFEDSSIVRLTEIHITDRNIFEANR